jgi:hypothetical protein
MVEGRGREAWQHTAALLCKLHNVNCAKKSDMVRDPSIFNPYAQRDRARKPRRQKLTVASLAAAFGVAALPPAVREEADECLVVEKSSPNSRAQHKEG